MPGITLPDSVSCALQQLAVHGMLRCNGQTPQTYHHDALPLGQIGVGVRLCRRGVTELCLLSDLCLPACPA